MEAGKSIEAETFVRALEVRGLMEATAIVRLIDTIELLIAEARESSATDAIAEHCVLSWQRRCEALAAEYRELIGSELQAVSS